jgi:hypothetical protein
VTRFLETKPRIIISISIIIIIINTQIILTTYKTSSSSFKMQLSSIIFTSFFSLSLSLSLPDGTRNATRDATRDSAKLAPIRSILGDKVQLQICKRVAPQPDMMYGSFYADMYPALETCVNLDDGIVHSMGGPMAAFDNLYVNSIPERPEQDED